MQARKIKLLLFIIILLLQSVVWAGSVTKTGTTSAKFLNIGVGARANSMGGAYATIANDATAMYWNPAGIAQIEDYQIIFNQTDWIADINHSYIGLVLPAGSFGNIGFNITAITMGDMELTSENFPEGTGEKFSAGSYAIGFSYARYLTQNFMIGTNIKYINESIYNSTAQGVAIDIGTIFTTPFYGVKFSTSITNFGTKMQMTGDDLLIRHDPNTQESGNNDQIDAYYSTDEFDLPLRLQIGMAKDFRIVEGQRLTLAVDAAHPNDNSEYLNFGGELALLNEKVFLRGGFKSLFLEDREEGLTLGAGFNYKTWNSFVLAIDYAFQDFVHLGDVHTFGIKIGF